MLMLIMLAKNIDVTNTPKASTNATAELTFGLVLAVARRIVEGDKLSRTQGFDGWAPLFFRGREVSGKTIGIIGLGEIGGAVANVQKLSIWIFYIQVHIKRLKRARDWCKIC